MQIILSDKLNETVGIQSGLAIASGGICAFSQRPCKSFLLTFLVFQRHPHQLSIVSLDRRKFLVRHSACHYLPLKHVETVPEIAHAGLVLVVCKFVEAGKLKVCCTIACGQEVRHQKRDNVGKIYWFLNERRVSLHVYVSFFFQKHPHRRSTVISCLRGNPRERYRQMRAPSSAANRLCLNDVI